MFNQDVDQRLSLWYKHRLSLNNDSKPFESVINFWKSAPFIAFNHKIDRYNSSIWPTPWEIIVYNKYDDFTKALMIGWTLKLGEKYKNSTIVLKVLVDISTKLTYNVIVVDDIWILNFSESSIITAEDLPETIFIEFLMNLNDIGK
jgi:hypothetical protein